MILPLWSLGHQSAPSLWAEHLMPPDSSQVATLLSLLWQSQQEEWLENECVPRPPVEGVDSSS